MTPHNRANKNEIAKVVLMPGDPLRAKWVAETFLSGYKLVNDVRNMLAYTGKFLGKEVTVMGHGMGFGSVGIYSYELFHFYDVDSIIRIGSTGSYVKEIKVGDLILAKEAYSESDFAKIIGVPTHNNVLEGSKSLNDLIKSVAIKNNYQLYEVRVYSSDNFYGNTKTIDEIIAQTQAPVKEMEAFALFANAIKLNKKAATLLTCANYILTQQGMSSKERETKFYDMADLALKVAIEI